ncbi:glycoside hydrolase family 43 protein [Anaeromicropila herbilytica]|uniref:Glycoside hydrolase 43 family protein n=1 Tax=Anaeromicropila herbilytica TaxID=2785025 RepID=A0A7R7EKX2_9FIRM|nr:glycoside hydrolase family 43 protein [Anaeromicropila herbilytica]BCN30644.1 glycoside hydrolase 43 family protein [Anaeromicropila herbilytica]
MEHIKNPILPGFHPDPCICRQNDNYYMAVSSFEWFPGVPIYHSKDMKNWKLITHCLENNALADLRRLPSAKGVWAPCLTWCKEDGLFYLMYSIMNSMNARFFDVDNYLITAPSIYGPWSEPIYIHSAGFDPSMLHDEDGRKWITSLEWETRDGYHKPGEICIVEYDKEKKHIMGNPKRIWRGGTKRGCIEGPHMYKRNGYYYLMCAEGGTGYGHSVTVGRSMNILGPYESDPCNPILTSTPDFNEMDNDDAVKLNRYNPESYLQKSGHGSIVMTSLDEVYMVHHCGRPLLPDLRCTLGRETCIQKMYWTEDGWLRLFDGGNIARTEVVPSELSEHIWENESEREEFDSVDMPIHFYSPRIDYREFTSLTDRKGYLRIRGQESMSSLNRVSLVAHKLTTLHAIVTTKMDFKPEVYQQYAGILIYYDNMDYIMLRKTYSEKDDGSVIDLLRVKNGERIELLEEAVSVSDESIYFQIRIEDRETEFFWSMDGEEFHHIGGTYDTSEFSDEFCKNGEFTGTFVGIGCVDALLHEKYADFDYFEYQCKE